MPQGITVLRHTEYSAVTAVVVGLAHGPESKPHCYFPVKAELGDGGGEGATDRKLPVQYNSVEEVIRIRVTVFNSHSELESTLCMYSGLLN